MVKAKDVATYIFQKLGVNANQVDMVVDSEIQRQPRVQGRAAIPQQRRQQRLAACAGLRTEEWRRVYKC